MADYSEIVRQMKREELQGSLYVGARQSPDTEAKLQRLADRWGVPVDSVRRNQPEVELQDRLRSFDYEKVIRDSPKLSTWLADPKNAAVAHDDYENLSRIEKLLTTGRDYAGAVGQGVIGQGFGSLLSGAGELYGVATRSFERGLGLVLPKSAMDALTAKVLPWWTDPGQVLKRPGQTLKDIGTAIGPPRERQSLGTDVASGIGQLGFQIAAFMMTGGTSSTTMMFAQGADVMADKTAKDKADPMMRDIAIVGGGAITAITEKYGLDKILNRVPPQIKNRVLRFIADKVAAGGIEAGQEIAEGLLHDLTRRLLTNRDAEILQGVDREASAAALSAAIVRSALGVRGFRQAQQTEDFFRALGDESKSAKLRERLPERFQALIDRYTEDGPVKEVMIPAKQFTEYFQSVGMDPAQIAAQAGARNYADALLGGTDVVIPMAGFMTTIAPTDHLQGLSQDLRLAQDENTPREMKQAEANRPEAERRLREELAAINEAAKSDQSLDAAIQRVIADVEGQLTSRYDQQTARAIATTMRGVAVLANRANPTADPLQAAQALWEKYGLTVDPLAQRGGEEGQGYNAGMTEDEYIARINPTGKRLAEGERPTIYAGDIEGSMPEGATRLTTRKTKDGKTVELYRDPASGAVWAKVDGVEAGFMSPLSDTEVDLSVAQEFQGQGIGAMLSTEFRRANPFAQSGGLTEGGERTARAAFRALQAEGAFNQTPGALPIWSLERAKGARITGVIKKAAIALAPKASLARRNYEKLDAIFKKVPNPLESEESWRKFMSLLVADRDVLGVPYAALRYAQNPEAVAEYLSRLRPDQLASRRAGFELGAKIRAQYAAGNATPVTTGRLLLWAMLSRKAGAYPHEAAYMDLVNGGVDQWIEKAASGNWTESDGEAYAKWSSEYMATKKGGVSPASQVTSNANDFGRILLTKMSEKDENGVTQLTRLHNLIADQGVSTDLVRREFFALGDSLGIQNKVLSFALLVTGRWDTLVLDRVQFTHLWGDQYRERAGQRNIYDGSAGGLAPAGEGHFGLAVYEALARGMSESVRKGYELAGLTGQGDGTLGAFHWDSWLIESSQAIGHPTVEALATDRPRPDLAVRQGKFDTYSYNFEYRADGQYQIPLLDGSGYRILSPADAAAFAGRIADDKEGVVPRDFKVSKNKSSPWVDAEGVNRGRYDEILNEFGRRADAADVAPAGLADAGGPVQQRAADAGRANPAGTTGTDTLEQSAYHGTPHRGIQKFSTDKIGTGEGAQAYGWGLYFASLRDVAEWYREKLQEGKYDAMKRVMTDSGLSDAAQEKLFGYLYYDKLEPAVAAGLLKESSRRATESLSVEQITAIAEKAAVAEPVPGQLYEVEIPEDSEMLDWDKPLSEQPEGVQKVMREVAAREGDPANLQRYFNPKNPNKGPTGQDFYNALAQMMAAPEPALSWTSASVDTADRAWSGERAASEYLLSLGIKGIKYLDGTSRGAGDGSYNYVVFSGDDVAIKNQFYQGTQQARGQIRIAPDRKMNVKLFENANLSTFLHESGHFYLEVLGDLAEADGTSQQVKDDYARILKFLGVNSRSEIRVEHHEKWARANEAYLMEGKAPAAELKGVFQRFSAWLKVIYRELSRLNVTLTDEVRGVMDRIYATDAEIARAEAEANFTALLLDAKTAGMTDAEFEVYRKAVVDTTVEAKEELQTKLMRIERLKREAWWREELAKVAEEVGKEYDATVVAQAFERMVAKDSAERLNRQQIIDRYGEDVLKRLPRGYKDGKGAVYAADGQDIDATAEAMGFGSADEMIASLQAMPNRARHIAAEANARMMERHGDLLNSVALADEAMAALHNEKREQVLKIELRALNKQIGGDLIPDDMLRGMAEGIIGQKEIRDLNPYAYLVAGRKAGREAFEQMAEGGNRMTAFRAKQQELLNHYMYLAALRAKKETDGIIKYLRGFEKTTTRQKLGKAGADYLDQIDAILERYELKTVSLKALGKREALAAWLLEQENQGNAVAVPQEIQDESRRVNWRQIPVDELRAVRDSVKNIAHLANLKNKLLRKGKLLEFETVVAELLTAPGLAQMGSTGDLSRPNQKGATVRQSGARAWRKFDAAHIKIEQLVEWLDGGKIDGPWARYFFDLADAAQTMEYDLHAKVTTKIEQISKSMPKAWREGIFDSTAVRLPGFDGPMTRYDLLSIAMNMGNAQNIQRLKDGYQWTDAHLDSVRNALTSTDWTFVQNTWDALELLWPEMAALEERHSGLPPEKVAPMPFTAAGLNLRGGYFPLVYDPRFSGVGEKQANEAESVQNFMAQGYGRASTNRGATKQRVETLKAGPLLDYEQIITSHLSKVIKDISHREAVIGINKILMQEDVKRTLIDKIGEADYLTMRQWLQTLVMDRADTLHQATGPGAWLMKARTNMAIVTMGWKISTMMAQFAGFTPVLDFVKPQYLTKALIQSVTSPQETWAMISQKSGEMRNRANTIERDARDALLRMRGEGGMLADVRRTAFFLTAYADKAVSVPAWLGAYQQALAEGKSEEDAIRAGDRAVRLSQGAGGAKDLSRVQNSNELMRLLTMYYTPFNVLYARLRDVGHQTAVQGIGYLPKAVARLTALVMIPAVLGDLLAGRGPDDDEDEVWWAIRKTLLYPVATIPVVRDMANYLEAELIKASGEGEMKFPPSYKLSPVMGAIEKVARLPGKIADAATGEKPVDDVVFDTVETSGYVLGLPTSQVRITGEYLWDLLTGQASPDNAAEIMRDALFRREQK